ncbi:C-type lectin domain family 2 member B-like [Phalacrocorax aristotelis]|uniref:C-type lectin domain family 2 member B-like n=1 Tax=Phalacrocorax aristotelis TaxID=126867 RepID=UPI003F4CA27E
MGKGAQNTELSDPEEALSCCEDAKKEYKWGSDTKRLEKERSRSSQVFVACVVLGLIVLALLVALTVVHLGRPLPHPDFSYVCPDAWLGFQGKCYYFSDVESNWTSSEESCKALGASLAVISNLEEMTFIKRYKGEANHWFGLRKEDDGWRWTNGTAFNNWFEVRGGGPCAYLNQERISSSLCHTMKHWLCSRADDYVLWKQRT